MTRLMSQNQAPAVPRYTRYEALTLSPSPPASTNASFRGALRPPAVNFSAVAPRASAPASVQFDKAPPIAKLGGRGAWSGDELVKNPFWGRELSRAELDELDGALARAMGSGALEFDADDPSVPLNIDREAFALPAGGALARTLGALAEELEHGSGACMLANFPVDRYDEREAAVAYAGVCAHVGQWVPQSSAGLRSKSRGFGMPLGKIRAEMRGATPKDGKQSNNYFRLHTDRCDVISLLGVRVAAAGGHSRVASAVTIHDAMLERAPELVPLMYAPIERLWEGGRGIVKLPIWARHPDTGAFTTQLSPSYIENAQLVSGTRPLTDDEIEVRIAREDAARARVRAGVSETRAARARAQAIDLIEEIGLEHAHEFLQGPGNLSFLNNHLVYHGRTAWKYEGDEQDAHNGRLLLRCWLSPYNSRELPDTPEFNEVWGSVAAGVARGGLEPALAAGLAPKPAELVAAINSGKVDYYGLYKRKFAGEDVNL